MTSSLMLLALLSCSDSAPGEAPGDPACRSASNTPQPITIGDATFSGHCCMGAAACRLTGAGTRRKFGFPMYYIGLYVDAKPSANNIDRRKVAAADRPMLARLHIVSSLITPSRLASSVQSAFGARNAGRFARELSQLGKRLPQRLSPGDEIDVAYIPGHGTELRTKDKVLCHFKDAAFKTALFGVWLSDDCVDESLRDDLLSGLKSHRSE